MDEIDDIINFANQNIKSVYEPNAMKNLNIDSLFEQEDLGLNILNKQRPEYKSLSSNFNSTPNLQEEKL